MSDLDGQNVRQFRARGAGVTGMTGMGGSGLPGSGETGRPIRRLSAPITQPFPVVSQSDVAPDEHVDDLIAAYALGALDADERLSVERHAGYCPICARQLADMRRTTTMLPFAVATAAPSPDVKAALFARIAHSTAPVAAEDAEDYQWARPVRPQSQVTLPSSGAWLDSQPVAAASAPVVRNRRSRRSFGRALGISVPVFLTFGLLALFVIPQMMPSGESDDSEFAGFLNGPEASCADGSGSPLTTSAGISACGYFLPSTVPNLGTLFVSNLVDNAAHAGYTVSVSTENGYWTAGQLEITGPTSGQLEFRVPDGANSTSAELCITGADEDPNLVCGTTLTPAA